MAFQKGHSKYGGRQRGTGNAVNGYKVLPRDPLNVSIPIQARPATETPGAKALEAERGARWENSPAGQLARPEVSPEEQARRARALEARYVNRPHEAPPPSKKPTTTLQERNRVNYGASDGSQRHYNALLAQAEREAIAAKMRASGSRFDWSPFSPWASPWGDK